MGTLLASQAWITDIPKSGFHVFGASELKLAQVRDAMKAVGQSRPKGLSVTYTAMPPTKVLHSDGGEPWREQNHGVNTERPIVFSVVGN